MQQADYQFQRPTSEMQESVSMHKSPTPSRHSRMNQARSEKSIKRGREIGKTEARRLMERKTTQQNKNRSEELKQGLPRHSRTAKVKTAGGGTLNFP